MTCRVFRALGGADILVDQAVEDGFSADLPCADVGHGRGVSVGFVVGDALGGRPGLRCLLVSYLAAASLRCLWGSTTRSRD